MLLPPASATGDLGPAVSSGVGDTTLTSGGCGVGPLLWTSLTDVADSSVRTIIVRNKKSSQLQHFKKHHKSYHKISLWNYWKTAPLNKN